MHVNAKRCNNCILTKALLRDLKKGNPMPLINCREKMAFSFAWEDFKINIPAEGYEKAVELFS